MAWNESLHTPWNNNENAWWELSNSLQEARKKIINGVSTTLAVLALYSWVLPKEATARGLPQKEISWLVLKGSNPNNPINIENIQSEQKVPAIWHENMPNPLPNEHELVTYIAGAEFLVWREWWKVHVALSKKSDTLWTSDFWFFVDLPWAGWSYCIMTDWDDIYAIQVDTKKSLIVPPSSPYSKYIDKLDSTLLTILVLADYFDKLNNSDILTAEELNEARQERINDIIPRYNKTIQKDSQSNQIYDFSQYNLWPWAEYKYGPIITTFFKVYEEISRKNVEYLRSLGA